jgi:glyoxylase-like metal-dependent hydrolase (beta-lactamase superfamily II)
MDGKLNEQDLLAVAEPLGLHGPSLVELAKQAWRPEKVDVEGLFGYNSPFPVPGYEEMTVNSYLVVDKAAGVAVAFDTGADVTDMLADLEREGVKLEQVLLTHTHDDHIKALDELLKATGNPPVRVNNKEAIARAKGFDAGKTFTVGGLTIESRLTNGHSPGGTTYVITGLARPVAIVGDSLFCCSQGGARGAYGMALENNRKQILSLPDNTVLCPGHGPVTTVAEEKAHNPFFPEFKS